MATLTQVALQPTRVTTLLPKRDELVKTEDSKKISFPLPPPRKKPTIVLDVDKNTPDFHVPRDPRLIRLTGAHPYNVEAPLTDLYNEGIMFLQPLTFLDSLTDSR